jgi:integrase
MKKELLEPEIKKLLDRGHIWKAYEAIDQKKYKKISVMSIAFDYLDSQNKEAKAKRLEECFQKEMQKEVQKKPIHSLTEKSQEFLIEGDVEGYLDHIKTHYKINNQIANCTQARKFLILHGYARLAGQCKLSSEQYEKRNKEYAERVQSRANADLLLIDPEHCLSIAKREIKKIDDTAVSIDSAIVALVALTGRRPSELLFSGEFYNAKKHGSYWICKFRGLVKKRAVSDMEIEIPIFCPLKDVNKILEVARNRYPATCERDTTKANPNLNHKAHILYCDVIKMPTMERIKCQLLRGMYATIAYDYCSHDNEGMDGYASKILGHLESDADLGKEYLGTQLSYRRFRIRR